PAFRYNRVDGAAVYGTLKYENLDSLLPIVWFSGGYAFESERWRYEAGLEQVLWRTRPLSVGGALYRKLASEDDWLISDRENLFFTLLVTEDFKDYYEAEGGRLYTRFKPLRNLTFEGGYKYEETKWIRSHRNIWSLFGGDKVFPRNFGSVTEPYRGIGIGEIDSTVNAGLYAQLDFDTRDPDEPFEHSAWAATGTVEWSHPDFESDFDYRRYTVNLRRYQKINRHSIMLFRGMYGGSDGYLPLYKSFFLGGLGTLEGYKHKEFMGSRFWMANFEYRITFPSSDISYSLLYDVGQISNTTGFEDEDEIKHSIGMALYIENDLRLSISKRLDSADDKDPKIYARLTHQF
ncbi:MAG: BamA/TamA family outer membrane protein, partial [candidate division Zixibacteria bacterium]|nr:BamA/TamA family outer membrane protein [candidate division Zixibacteria bacterium]